MSDGSTVTPAVTYAATGGTISAGGLYTAGTTAGTFRVIATQQGGSLADTAAVTITLGHSYTTSFPLTENPISEGGNWINGATVGLDWSDSRSENGHGYGWEIQQIPYYNDATSLLTGTWGADQQATATVYVTTPPAGPQCSAEVELRLRSALAAHSNTGYEITWSVGAGSSGYLIIVRWNGTIGDFSYLANLHGSQYNVVNGDVVVARIVGNVISAYKNGVQQASVNITSIGGTVYNSGQPGMGFCMNQTCAGINATYGYTSFSATDTP
jgi:hypothetical protein